jgi:hypothetical protein
MKLPRVFAALQNRLQLWASNRKQIKGFAGSFRSSRAVAAGVIKGNIE